MATPNKGRKTINQLCREYNVADIWALADVFQYWLDCGNTDSVIKNFSSLRKSSRNELFKFFLFNEHCYRQLMATVLDIALS